MRLRRPPRSKAAAALLRQAAEGRPVIHVNRAVVSGSTLARLVLLGQQLGYRYVGLDISLFTRRPPKLTLEQVADPEVRQRSAEALDVYRRAGGEELMALPPALPASELEPAKVIVARLKLDGLARVEALFAPIHIVLLLGLIYGTGFLPFPGWFPLLVGCFFAVPYLFLAFLLGRRGYRRRLRKAGYLPVEDDSGRTRYVPAARVRHGGVTVPEAH
ncbi:MULTISPECIES: hypothetical protein [unclassified Streptomyces]|uniref:hypothetical protein n=1 Tax=unclassified Streptomyces TaxID=2593676 RepID=UPI0022B70B50|nr:MULTISPECIES: hypothetical protein [unclassified Streptomyces]MCZ7415370.1 hypothetical protein [Streptomyces sp. WMMC897]MCZ7432292.1 hypothetical protein [Streptomyces sp. WMMC1477]